MDQPDHVTKYLSENLEDMTEYNRKCMSSPVQ